ncbi:hypothetical protein TRIUR3_01604 [Triticum urartu]|uniref:Uncharacterized protein n=1 Tax=Triticum urartu TaxID=4572 RepID=M8APS0_TRIUA|nr:hypothetical protein TRIUR3_01604 [Triticum urartu]
MVAPTDVGFLIFVSGDGGYGIAQPQAREKSLLGLPILATTTSVDVVFFLDAMSRPAFVSCVAPLFVVIIFLLSMQCTKRNPRKLAGGKQSNGGRRGCRLAAGDLGPEDGALGLLEGGQQLERRLGGGGVGRRGEVEAREQGVLGHGRRRLDDGEGEDEDDEDAPEHEQDRRPDGDLGPVPLFVLPEGAHGLPRLAGGRMGTGREAWSWSAKSGEEGEGPVTRREAGAGDLWRAGLVAVANGHPDSRREQRKTKTKVSGVV